MSKADEAPPFTIRLATVYGDFILPRHDIHQCEPILRTGRPHIASEIEALLSVVDDLGPEAVVLDVGANVGLIAIPLGRRLAERDGILLAFEPQRLIFYMLAGNVAANGLQNIFCHQLAVSNRQETLALPPVDYGMRQDFGMVRLGGANAEADMGMDEAIAAVSIDSLGLDRVDLIKIDVETMEHQVLEGGIETIGRYRPFIWIEAWPEQWQKIHEIVSIMDYSMYVFDELNFFVVPNEKVAGGYKVKMFKFEGELHPYW